MIRIVTIVSLGSLLVLVLYLPVANPPERFLAQMRIEHRHITDLWGEGPALRILDRALEFEGSARKAASQPPAIQATTATEDVNTRVAQELAEANRRLFDNDYVRSLGGLVLLGGYRLSTLLEWLPWLAPFALVALGDGLVARVIKSKEFRQHDPEWFAVHVCLVIIMGCGLVVGSVIPGALDPLVLPGVLVGMCLVFGRAVGSFHRRG